MPGATASIEFSSTITDEQSAAKFLEDRFDVPVPANGRYLTFPTIDNEQVTSALVLERPIIAEVFWTELWSELDYGIGSEQFNYLNSDEAGNVQDPVQRWRWSEEGQIEIWPMNSTAQVIRFTGQRALDALAAPTDTADLDDQLIVLAVAAELLARKKQQDAQLKQAMFVERLRSIRASYPSKRKYIEFGGQDEDVQRPKLVSIAVAKNP